MTEGNIESTIYEGQKTNAGEAYGIPCAQCTENINSYEILVLYRK